MRGSEVTKRKYTSIEVCAGAGGQALGLERAGFAHLACVEIDPAACATLRRNREHWNVIEADLRTWSPSPEVLSQQVDLLAGGVPCPPFSLAGRQLGRDDERDLFPEMIRLVEEIQPRAVMIENVRGLMARKFEGYRAEIMAELKELGYELCGWELVNAADYGVPQARLRSILVAMVPDAAVHFRWPEPRARRTTVGEALKNQMKAAGWEGADEWARRASDVAPALVGGSKKHGGADLGPTRAKAAWRQLGVDAMGVADAPPPAGTDGMPRLTVEMAATIQGFPASWKFQGRKTAAYRQVGNAFPPPVAKAIGDAIRAALLVMDVETEG
ncbi:DNA cytosine methyltransferase [Gordonia paraffinivorans]|uniref:DNA cytosine methyltransferase n=1 Tax=Gordonia paraffinivorans TaxID=175628 RepID=UPI001E31E3B6|nr:DNA (cytosine-5-)-methyltransferase [Gordonia paraffinivorans]MCD2144549.1 DNA (cytosine-5-)-methyltransferase [Gordonia paraffinivorans]